MSAVGALFMDLQERPAFEQGTNAYSAGVKRADNPHRVGSLDFTAWQMGWDHEIDDRNDG